MLFPAYHFFPSGSQDYLPEFVIWDSPEFCPHHVLSALPESKGAKTGLSQQ